MRDEYLDEEVVHKPDDIMDYFDDVRPAPEPLPEFDKRTRYVFGACESPIGVKDPRAIAALKKEFPAGALDVPSQAVLKGRVPRCVVVWLVSPIRRLAAEQVPDEFRLPDDPTAYQIPAGAELLTIMEQCAEYGLVEITELAGWEPKRVKALKLTEIFFPTWPELPELLRHDKQRPELPSVEGMIRNAIARIKKGELGDADKRGVYEAIAKDMILSCQVADEYLRGVIKESEGAILLPSTDPRYKVSYDRLDELGFERTGITPKKDAMERLAQDRQVVVNVEQGQGGNDTLVAAVLKQNELLTSQLTKTNQLLAQFVPGQAQPDVATATPPTEKNVVGKTDAAQQGHQNKQQNQGGQSRQQQPRS